MTPATLSGCRAAFYAELRGKASLYRRLYWRGRNSPPVSAGETIGSGLCLASYGSNLSGRIKLRQPSDGR